MTNKNVIKMILLYFGYTNIEIKTFHTGTSDGQFENSIAYVVNAVDPDGDNIEIRESDYKETIKVLFYKLTDTDVNDKKIRHIDKDIWNKLK